MERLYQHRPWMVEGMYCIGTIPQSTGEGAHIIATSLHYQIAWQYWDMNSEKNITIYVWRNGTLNRVGRRKRNAKTGKVYYVLIPPAHIESA